MKTFDFGIANGNATISMDFPVYDGKVRVNFGRVALNLLEVEILHVSDYDGRERPMPELIDELDRPDALMQKNGRWLVPTSMMWDIINDVGHGTLEEEDDLDIIDDVGCALQGEEDD